MDIVRAGEAYKNVFFFNKEREEKTTGFDFPTLQSAQSPSKPELPFKIVPSTVSVSAFY